MISNKEIAEQNKISALSFLQQTDWAVTVGIADPSKSSPHLVNQEEFLTYRSEIRNIFVNPPLTRVTFPEMPNAIWSS